MSFLNPVNEPVLRFSSTDAGAPQINYNARVAGDVKAVLKACLVTGYGTTASAGWTGGNEVGNTIEFVSPSAAMSDYRLGIDDTSTSSTTWYYQYQNVRTNPNNNSIRRNMSYINNSSTSNGWQLIVTDRGLYFIETVLHDNAQKTFARLTWMGQVKSSLSANAGINMSYFCVGIAAPLEAPYQVFANSSATSRFYRLEDYTQVDFAAANISTFTSPSKTYGISSVDVICDLFLTRANNVVAKQAGLLLYDVSSSIDAWNVSDVAINSRSCVKAPLGYETGSAAGVLGYLRVVLIPLDYWEY